MVFGSPKQRSLLPGVSREQAFDWAASLFKQVMPQVADYGITICMEPLSTAETDFINTCAEASELIDAVGHANFAVSSNGDPVRDRGQLRDLAWSQQPGIGAYARILAADLSLAVHRRDGVDIEADCR